MNNNSYDKNERYPPMYTPEMSYSQTLSSLFSRIKITNNESPHNRSVDTVDIKNVSSYRNVSNIEPRVSHRNDPLEIEANNMAEQIVAFPGSMEKINNHRAAQIYGKNITNNLSDISDETHLNKTENFVEGGLNYDFSRVRIYDNQMSHSIAGKINAKAFSIGDGIYLGRPYHVMNPKQKLKLVIHELIHTKQNKFNNTNAIYRDEWGSTVIGDPRNLKRNSRKGIEALETHARLNAHEFTLTLRDAARFFKDYVDAKLEELSVSAEINAYVKLIYDISQAIIDKYVPLPVNKIGQVFVEKFKDHVESKLWERLSNAHVKDKENALQDIGESLISSMLDISMGIRDKVNEFITPKLSLIIEKLDNDFPLAEEEKELVAMFYGGPAPEIRNEYIEQTFSIPNPASSKEIRVKYYRDLVFGFEKIYVPLTSSLYWNIYYATRTIGRMSGYESEAYRRAEHAAAQRRKEEGMR